MQENNGKLFIVSLLTLFLELLLIRWISTEVRIFAYAGNLVLLACFLGIGAGCYRAHREANVLLTMAMLVLIALAVRSAPFLQITEMLSGFSDSLIWFQPSKGNLFFALQGICLTVFLFIMVLASFVPLGQMLGNMIESHRNTIIAYSINIAGSLAGIWCFSLLSFYYTPPWLWLVFALGLLILFVPLAKRQRSIAAAAALLILLTAGTDLPGRAVVWSPYQKLDVFPQFSKNVQNGVLITVNSVTYMSATNLSRDFLQENHLLADPAALRFNQYAIPYALNNRIDSVLIVGAGAGNDIAGAVRSTAREIDAVEIDPGIYALGAQLHPEQPYQNPRVRVLIDDARAYFKKTEKKYDLIVFGLLDSHTLSSQYNNMRLDNYVYTEESFREARQLLKDDGILVLSFAVEQDWLGDRLYGTLKKVFGEVPYVFRTMMVTENLKWGGVMFITGNNQEALKGFVASNPELKEYIQNNSVSYPGSVQPATDNWPYLYIRTPSIPAMYLFIIAALLVVFMVAGRLMGGGASLTSNRHFFFLGCAFMLLEFQNVSKAALLFGATWLVNAYIISAILVLTLAANAVVYALRVKNCMPVYAALAVSIIILYVVPPDTYHSAGYPGATAVAALLLNAPIFFSGIIFITSFSQASQKDRAFGANLMGAALGGLLEPVSFITGIKALLLGVFALYALAFFFRPQAHQ
jgi:SAM-dependent methyltransferase